MWWTVSLWLVLASTLSVHAALPDDCKQPPETGPCRALILMYYYDTQNQSCKTFNYGGCQGNQNRFSTQQECLSACRSDETNTTDNSRNALTTVNKAFCVNRSLAEFVNKVRAIIGLGPLQTTRWCNEEKEKVCLHPPETGPCRARIPHFFYNAQTETCENFVYGGCLGNGNRFNTRQECVSKCAGVFVAPPGKRSCSLPPKTGPCRARFTKFYFNPATGLCQEFIYGGCQGNDNRFDTQQKCIERCHGTPLPTVSTNPCALPREPGMCRAYIPQYFYNSISQTCEEFIYGGCGGNGNRFDSQAECEGRCREFPVRQEKCRLPADTGPCYASIPHYFHNIYTGMCEKFIFGGCQGNDNRFISEQECQSMCLNSSPPTQPKMSCLLPPETGPCRGNFPSYFYNATYGTCNTFVYGGCSGNDNRFDSESQCLQKCQGGTVRIISGDVPEICRLPAETGMCRGFFQMFHFNVTSGKCEPFVYGGCDGNDNKFDTDLDCRRKCDVSASPPPGQVCLLPSETGPCRGAIPKFFFNSSAGSCEEFVFGGCLGNDNRFDTQFECEEMCRDILPTPQRVVFSPTCLLPPETGPCRARFTRFYFNSTTESCEQFVYGGCQGNDNRFDSQRDCQERCGDTLLPGTPTP